MVNIIEDKLTIEKRICTCWLSHKDSNQKVLKDPKGSRELLIMKIKRRVQFPLELRIGHKPK